MRLARAVLAGHFLSLFLLSRLQAAPSWGPSQLLDPRTPLEIAQIRQEPLDGQVYLPVLFDLATNSLELGRIDALAVPPTATFAPVASGAIFALGTAGQAGNQVGFSFIDGSFDSRFGTCAPPCNSVANLLVNAGTWIDNASAASADDFFVAALDNNANHGISIFSSINNGTTWNPLNTLVPPETGGVLPSINGGKRIHLVVDPAATNPATTRNCLLYEVRPTLTTTALRLNCRTGATPGFNVVVDSDIPNPTNQFDKFIEDSCVIVADGVGGSDVMCVYSHRQTARMRVIRANSSGLVTGPIVLPPVPGGTTLHGTTVRYGPEAEDDLRILFPAGNGAPAHDVTSHPAAGQFDQPGPPAETGPVSLTFEEDPFDPIKTFLMVFFVWAHGLAADEPLGGGGLAVALYPVPLFADGFETQNLLRW